MRNSAPRATPAIAYVVKGFPRLSEIFIASEILRMEANGVPLRLLVIKSADVTVARRSLDATGTEAR